VQCNIRKSYNSRAVARKIARCRCKFRYVSNFTRASCGFSATSRLSCIGLHQRPFKFSTLIFTAVMQNHGDSRKSRHATDKSHDDRKYVIILKSYKKWKCDNNWSRLRSLTLVSKHSISSVNFVRDTQSHKSQPQGHNTYSNTSLSNTYLN